ncbi:MAG: AhpC/TSA family protein [Bacteroidetes bacterium]|nr:AhpC/TSA family protein [Bacteroidota bacterium]
MKKIISTLYFVTAFLFANAQQKLNNNFFVKGTIEGRDTGFIILKYIDGNNKRIADTCTLKNGLFVFKGYINEPTLVNIIGKRKSRSVDDPNFTEIFIEPDTISVYLKENEYKNVRVLNSKTNNEYYNLINKVKPFSIEKDSLFTTLLNLEKEESTNISKAIKDSLKNIKSEIRFKMSSIKEKIKQIDIDFAKQNPTSFVSPFVLNTYTQVLSVGSLKEIYNRWSKPVQHSKQAQLIYKEIVKKESNMIGGFASEFTFQTIYNKTINLSDFKDKQIVLIDFWASWCIPCREAFPELKKIYAEYSRKGLAIIAVTIDENLQTWRNAIQQDSIGQWYHTTATKQPKVKTEDDIIEKYETNGIPTQYLIDKNGKIIGKWFGYSEANEKELRKLISENLK